MSSYTITTTLNQPYPAAADAVRTALGDQGLGVLTEIDLKAALKEKLDVDIAPQIILGAGRPPLAYEATKPNRRSRPYCRATSSSGPWRRTPPWSRRSTSTP